MQECHERTNGPGRGSSLFAEVHNGDGKEELLRVIGQLLKRANERELRIVLAYVRSLLKK